MEVGDATPAAARMIAGQVRDAQRSGTPIEYVVLDACHQRDRRRFVGESNGEALQRALNAELQTMGLGHLDVTVLAASRGGPTYGAQQRSYLPSLSRKPGEWMPRFRHEFTNATYAPADHGRLYVSKQDYVIGGTIGLLALEGAVISYVVAERRRAAEDAAPAAEP